VNRIININIFLIREIFVKIKKLYTKILASLKKLENILIYQKYVICHLYMKHFYSYIISNIKSDLLVFVIGVCNNIKISISWEYIKVVNS